MRSISTGIVIAILSALTAAQNDDQPSPFKLFVRSEDKTIDGQFFGACPTGAAVEGLCIGGDDVFYHNVSQDAKPSRGLTAPGELTFLLPADPVAKSAAMSLENSPTRNVAAALFHPDEKGQLVAFGDGTDLMFIQDIEHLPVSQWYICDTNIGDQGGLQALNWVFGHNAEPDNESCKSVYVVKKDL